MIGQFLIDRDGIVRRVDIEAVAGLENFPTDDEFLAAAQHVDRVDLDRADAVEQPAQVPARHRTVRPRVGEALRGEGEAARLVRREGVHRSGERTVSPPR